MVLRLSPGRPFGAKAASSQGPRPRSEAPPELRELLLDIRREQPAASVPTILLELQNAGRLAPGTVTAATVRRLFREHGLDRVSLKHAVQAGERGRLRLRWEAEAPGLCGTPQ